MVYMIFKHLPVIFIFKTSEILSVISSGDVGQAIWIIPSCWGHICWVDEPDMERFQPRTELSNKQDHLLIQYQ